jgi:hypothetical protein
VRLQMASRCRELALFNLAVDSELRACDLVQLRVRDVCHGQNMASRALIPQQKTQRPVQFEITEPTRDAVSESKLTCDDTAPVGGRGSPTGQELSFDTKKSRRQSRPSQSP